MQKRRWPSIVALVCGLLGLGAGIYGHSMPLTLLAAALIVLSVYSIAIFNRLQR